MSQATPADALPPGRPSITLDDRPRITRGFRLQWEQVQDAWVLLYPEGMVKLNTSAGEILRHCDGERTVAAVVTEVEKIFETTGLADEVIAFLDIAARQRWVEARAPGD
jgi:pyrroloquinoline quinone biosynthesis protein D